MKDLLEYLNAVFIYRSRQNGILCLVMYVVLLCCCRQTLAMDWQAPLLQHHPLTGRIYDLERKQEISEQDLMRKLLQAQFVLVGEKHDNKDHHTLEMRLVQALTSRADKPAVVYEMLRHDQQSRLDTLPASASLMAIRQHLIWPEKSWPWRDYGPLFLLTRQAQAPLIAGNISRERIMALYGQQQEALADARFDSVEWVRPEVQDKLYDQVYDSHCQLLPRKQLSPMVDIQLARDASMASAMLTHLTPAGAILIAGNYHVSKDVGVPLHLQGYKPEAKPVVVSLMEVAAGQNLFSDYSNARIADFLWLTPKQNEKDHCADMRLQMQQKSIVD
ncbi:MAG: ChaN family lipoprotein [Marinobacterium sp.]|nr:ChaN family lipoprotein [Marinobacterium sp.]